MNAFFPEYLTNQSPFLFLVHFLFVGLVFLGQYFLCLWIQERKEIFVSLPLESFLFVPYFLFPLEFLFLQLGWGNFFYLTAQVLFITLAVFGIFRYRNKINLRFFQRWGMLEWICYGIIIVLGYFGWLVPIPESYNGHGHFLWNLLTRMLHTGGYTVWDKSHFSTPDIVQLFWAPTFPFLLRFYCLNHPLFFYRSALLVPMIVGFLLVRLVKDICKIFGFPKEVGLFGFLAVIGTYFNSLTLYEVQYDIFSLLILLYFFFLLACLLVRKKSVLTSILILLFFSFLVRRQVFLLLFFSFLFFFLIYFKPFRRLWVLKRWPLLLGFFPVAIWTGLCLVRYDNPVYPEYHEQVHRWLQKIDPTTATESVVNIKTVPLRMNKKEQDKTKDGKDYGARIGYFITLLHSTFPQATWIPFAVEKMGAVFFFLIRAGPLSFLLTLFFFLLLWMKKIEAPEKEFLILEGILFWCWIIAGVLFFIGYRKHPQYLSVITFLPAGFMLYFIQRKFFRLLPVFLGLYLFLNFNVLLFGHHNVSFRFPPAQILMGQKTFIEKLAYKSNKSVAEVEGEVRELAEAYQSGKRILHMDVEPGALLPSLMGKEFLGEAFYFSLFDYPLKDVLTATNKNALARALEQRDIGFVFIPQKTQGDLDAHPLMQALGEFKKQSKYRLLVPIGDILKAVRYEGLRI